MSNEYDVVVFDDFKIYTTNDQVTQPSVPLLDVIESDSEEAPVPELVDEVYNENETDIYSDEHTWDRLPMRRYRHRPDIWLTEDEIKNMYL